MTFPSPKDLSAETRDAVLAELVPDALLRQVLTRPVDRIGQITVYHVANSSESAELAKHPNVTVATDDAMIRHLLAGPAGPMILVPAALGHTPATLSHLMPQGASGKALLLEPKT